MDLANTFFQSERRKEFVATFENWRESYHQKLFHPGLKNISSNKTGLILSLVVIK